MSDRPHTDLPLTEILGLDYRKPHKYPSSPPPDEILAFKCAACGEWVRDDEDSECSVAWNPPTPTVDDLLNWLACDVQAEIARVNGVWHVDLHHTDAGMDGEHTEGATLFAALEAAVRLVHDLVSGG